MDGVEKLPICFKLTPIKVLDYIAKEPKSIMNL